MQNIEGLRLFHFTSVFQAHKLDLLANLCICVSPKIILTVSICYCVIKKEKNKLCDEVSRNKAQLLNMLVCFEENNLVFGRTLSGHLILWVFHLFKMKKNMWLKILCVEHLLYLWYTLHFPTKANEL